MASDRVRAAIVGASTLLGKELARELTEAQDRIWDVALIDVVDNESAQAGGTVTSAGDEALIIQKLAPGAFDGMNVVFFAADGKIALDHAQEAVTAGAAVVDLTGALEALGALVAAPLVAATKISGKSVVSAHPAALLLGFVAKSFPNAALFATVLEPASQAGDAGVDEMHRQTVALLSFQSVPQDVFGQQVAFNLSASSADEAKAQLRDTATKVKKQMAQIAPAARVSSQFLQAPVFHGYSASIFVLTGGGITVSEAEDMLKANVFEIAATPADSTIAAVEQGAILARVSESDLQGLWLWVACDNLKLAAQNAMACARVLLP